MELTRGTLALTGAEGASGGGGGERTLTSGAPSTSSISWTLGSDGPSGGRADASGAAGFGGSSDILPPERNAETGPKKRFEAVGGTGLEPATTGL